MSFPNPHFFCNIRDFRNTSFIYSVQMSLRAARGVRCAKMPPFFNGAGSGRSISDPVLQRDRLRNKPQTSFARSIFLKTFHKFFFRHNPLKNVGRMREIFNGRFKKNCRRQTHNFPIVHLFFERLGRI